MYIFIDVVPQGTSGLVTTLPQGTSGLVTTSPQEPSGLDTTTGQGTKDMLMTTNSTFFTEIVSNNENEGNTKCNGTEKYLLE